MQCELSTINGSVTHEREVDNLITTSTTVPRATTATQINGNKRKMLKFRDTFISFSCRFPNFFTSSINDCGKLVKWIAFNFLSS